MLPENNQILHFIKIFEELITNFFKLLDVMMISPDSEGALDLYCKGMYMGLHGSSMIVKIANSLLGGLSFSELQKREKAIAAKAVAAGKKKSSKSGGSIDLWKTITQKIGEIGKAVLENNQSTDDL